VFRTFLATAAILCMISAAPAARADQAERNTLRVAYADLDLSREAGARSLFKRIALASRQVCGTRPSPKLIEANARYQACYRDSLSQAVAEIGSPLLSAMLNGQTGHREMAAR
jgi:UrcA family protein